MQARKITLIEIGAGALPSITPVPVRQSSWFPTVYVSPDVPPVEGVVPNPVADGVLIEWDAVDQEGVIYIIERGTTAEGPWMEIARVVETRYLYSDGSGQEWWFKITASVRGKPGEGAVVVAKPPQTVQDILDLFAEQAQQAADMAAGFAGQAAQIASLEAALSAADYDPAVGYAPGAVVKWEGGLYYALGETLGNPPSNATYWRKIGEYDSLAEAVGAQALIIATQQTRLEQAEDALEVVAEQADAVAAALPGKADASAVNALAGRVGQTEQGVEANAQAIQSANVAIGGKASSAALNALSSTVQQQGQSIEANATGLNSVRAELGGGGNLLPNSSFEVDAFGWAMYSNAGSGWGVGRDLVFDSRTPVGMHALVILNGGATTPGSSFGSATSPLIPVRPGARYIASAWLAMATMEGWIALYFYDSNGQMLLPVDGARHTTPHGGSTLGGYIRAAVEGVAPNNAATVRVVFWAVAQANGPALWVVRPMLEEARSTQSGPSPWQPGASGIDQKYAQVTQAIEARTTINENGIASYFSSWTMSLDANGRVAGIRSVNNGTTSTIDFLFDRVRFVSPGSGRRMEYSDGHFLGYDENNVRRIRLGTWSN